MKFVSKAQNLEETVKRLGCFIEEKATASATDGRYGTTNFEDGRK